MPGTWGKLTDFRVYLYRRQQPVLVPDLTLLLVKQLHELLQHGSFGFILGLDEIIELRVELCNGALFTVRLAFRSGQFFQRVHMSLRRGLGPFERIESVSWCQTLH